MLLPTLCDTLRRSRPVSNRPGTGVVLLNTLDAGPRDTTRNDGDDDDNADDDTSAGVALTAGRGLVSK